MAMVATRYSQFTLLHDACSPAPCAPLTSRYVVQAGRCTFGAEVPENTLRPAVLLALRARPGYRPPLGARSAARALLIARDPPAPRKPPRPEAPPSCSHNGTRGRLRPVGGGRPWPRRAGGGRWWITWCPHIVPARHPLKAPGTPAGVRRGEPMRNRRSHGENHAPGAPQRRRARRSGRPAGREPSQPISASRRDA
jgi:hypothetical protein